MAIVSGVEALVSDVDATGFINRYRLSVGACCVDCWSSAAPWQI